MEPQSQPPAPTAGWATRYSQVHAVATRPSARLRGALRHAGLSVAGRLVRSSNGAFLRCLFAHHVYDDEVESFRLLLRRLQRTGRFIRTEEVLAIARGQQPLEGRCFHLSFDDGLDNLYRNALPVLTELEIPVVIFLPTSFVGADDSHVLSNWWKPDEVACPTRPMHWSWVREMAALGHEFGSHTRTHPRLSRISDPRRLSDEIAGSKAEMEQRLGQPCRYFAWPYGSWQDVDAASMRAMEEAGYEACFSGVRGHVAPGSGRLSALPRHHIEPHWPWSHVRFFAFGGWESER